MDSIPIFRYFAIMFPTEYQRHSVSTSAFPYVIMIWTMSFAVSSTLFMEKTIDASGVCWIENPQYLVMQYFLVFLSTCTHRSVPSILRCINVQMIESFFIALLAELF